MRSGLIQNVASPGQLGTHELENENCAYASVVRSGPKRINERIVSPLEANKKTVARNDLGNADLEFTLSSHKIRNKVTLQQYNNG